MSSSADDRMAAPPQHFTQVARPVFPAERLAWAVVELGDDGELVVADHARWAGRCPHRSPVYRTSRPTPTPPRASTGCAAPRPAHHLPGARRARRGVDSLEHVPPHGDEATVTDRAGRPGAGTTRGLGPGRLAHVPESVSELAGSERKRRRSEGSQDSGYESDTGVLGAVRRSAGCGDRIDMRPHRIVRRAGGQAPASSCPQAVGSGRGGADGRGAPYFRPHVRGRGRVRRP